MEAGSRSLLRVLLVVLMAAPPPAVVSPLLCVCEMPEGELCDQKIESSQTLSRIQLQRNTTVSTKFNECEI